MLQKLNYQYFFSYLGLTPYIVVLIDKYFFFQINEEIILDFLIYYTILILVFIGSINWNLLLQVKNIIVIYGFLPSLLATIIIILNLFDFEKIYLIQLNILILFLQLIFDYYLIYKHRKKHNAFYYLRLPLTCIINLILILIII